MAFHPFWKGFLTRHTLCYSKIDKHDVERQSRDN